MKTITTNALRRLALAACAALAIPLTASAQTSNTTTSIIPPPAYNGEPDNSWLPFTRSGYWGVNFGRTDYESPCGAPGNMCDDKSVGAKIYTGGQFNKWLGAEVGYINFGKMIRNGGDTTAQGINLSLVGTVPIGHVFSAFGKVGTTYGFTEVDGNFGPTGSENDFGLSYGAGVGFHVTEEIQLLAEWEVHRLKFAGYEADVNLYSAGFKFRF